MTQLSNSPTTIKCLGDLHYQNHCGTANYLLVSPKINCNQTRTSGCKLRPSLALAERRIGSDAKSLGLNLVSIIVGGFGGRNGAEGGHSTKGGWVLFKFLFLNQQMFQLMYTVVQEQHTQNNSDLAQYLQLFTQFMAILLNQCKLQFWRHTYHIISWQWKYINQSHFSIWNFNWISCGNLKSCS